MSESAPIFDALNAETRMFDARTIIGWNMSGMLQQGLMTVIDVREFMGMYDERLVEDRLWRSRRPN